MLKILMSTSSNGKKDISAYTEHHQVFEKACENHVRIHLGSSKNRLLAVYKLFITGDPEYFSDVDGEYLSNKFSIGLRYYFR